MKNELLTGAELVVRGLEHLEVSTIFGVPGGAILPAYDPLYDSPIRHILARHEQGSGHMAEGYAQATGELGVVIATSGPGATNLITSLNNALMDSTPLLAITGQVATEAIGNDAFQEAFTVGLTMAATKHNYLITKASEIPQVLLEAKHIATTGRLTRYLPRRYGLSLPLHDACGNWYLRGRFSYLPAPTYGRRIKRAYCA